MLRGHGKFVVPDDLDNEIKNMIVMINEFEGVETTNSCFGHNKYPIRIFCVADSVADMRKLWYEHFYCHGFWSFKSILTDTAISNGEWDKVEFVIESDPHYIRYPVPQLLASQFDIEKKCRDMYGMIGGTHHTR